jgi:3-oxoadipate enol-lactonase
VTLHYAVRGDGPAVLLVHAGIADSRMWEPLAGRLVDAGYPVVTCDLRGFGGTPLERGDLDAAAQANVRTWVTRGGRAADPAVVALVAAMQRNVYDLQEGVDAELEPQDPPVAARLREIQAPALVAVGADDLDDFRRVAARLAAELPNAAPVVTIAGAAHLPALERPAEVAELLVGFLAALPR